MKDLFTGALTRLVAHDPDTIGELFAHASRDSEFLQLLDADTVKPIGVQQWQKEMQEFAAKPHPGVFPFGIQRLTDGRLIGEVGLWSALNSHNSCWLSVYIADRALWSQGFGSDAVKTVLRFGFGELNLHRIMLGTFGYNARAIHAYEKVGFVLEGRMRGAMRRHGERVDALHMGILRSEWVKLQGDRQNEIAVIGEG